jgi:hypothetical protein
VIFGADWGLYCRKKDYLQQGGNKKKLPEEKLSFFSRVISFSNNKEFFSGIGDSIIKFAKNKKYFKQIS